jgi:hypothetical protein
VVVVLDDAGARDVDGACTNQCNGGVKSRLTGWLPWRGRFRGCRAGRRRRSRQPWT